MVNKGDVLGPLLAGVSAKGEVVCSDVIVDDEEHGSVYELSAYGLYLGEAKLTRISGGDDD